MKNLAIVFLIEVVILLLLFNYQSSLLLGFFWIILHEMIHIIIGYLYGTKFYDIKIGVFGVNANLLNLEELNKRKKIIIYISGPIFNLFVAGVFWGLSWYIKSGFIIDSINLNLVLGIFNLMPLYPLDGSRILEQIISKRKANIFISLGNFIFGGIFFCCFVINYINNKEISMNIFLIAVFIIGYVFIENRNKKYFYIKSLLNKRNILIREEFLKVKNISVYYKVNLLKAMSLIDERTIVKFYVINDDMNIIYSLGENELIEAMKKYGNITLNEYICMSEKTMIR